MTGKTNVIKEVTREVIKEVGIPTTKGTSVVYHRSSTSTIEGSGDNAAMVFSVASGKKIIGIVTRFYGTEQLWIDVENRQVWYAGNDSNYAYRVCPESASMFTYVTDNIVKVKGYTNPAGYRRNPSGNNILSWIICA